VKSRHSRAGGNLGNKFEKEISFINGRKQPMHKGKKTDISKPDTIFSSVTIKVIFLILILVSFAAGTLVLADGSCGVVRKDLVGKSWDQLPPTIYPGFNLPLPWKTKNKFELRLFEPECEKYIVTIAKLLKNEQENENKVLIVAALDFLKLKEGEYPEQDCFYRNLPSCYGRLCEGLLIGVISQKKMSKDGTYVPKEVWEITSKNLKFQKVSPKNVVCKPQSYAG
jgi:hypothetical protein